MKCGTTFFCSLTLVGVLAQADEVSESVSVESTFDDIALEAPKQGLTLAIDEWPRVGTARLKVLFWEVYDSALYTPSGLWDENPPYQLSLSYLRDIPVRQLVEETEKAWRQQGISHAEQAVWLQQLNELWPDILKGDTLVFGVNAAGSNGFWFNGQFIGGIDHPDFGQLFAGIWLSEDSPRPKLRAQLIGIESQ
jgi:hypothetical protein